ncbi:MAG: hypothetical protein QOJ64_441 [Acidobacteriota bacterium]|jgi:hypothetical protein|nr:hypothetical protein [Acidobacteriota bacterium]
MDTSLAEIIDHADSLYDRREDIENVRKCLALLEREVYPSEYEAAWRVARALFFLGQESDSKSEAMAFHSSGAAAGRRAVSLDRSRVEGCFWLGVNLALLARLETPIKALPTALRARRFLKRAVCLNARYHGAGPLRVLARLQHKLPPLFGGGTSRARANFQRAIKLVPGNTVTRLYLAELLIDIGDREGGRVQLESLLAAPVEPGWNFETTRDREIAREMLRNAKLLQIPE